MTVKKGSLAAPLFFLLALAFACAGSRLGQVWPWAASAAALLGATRSGPLMSVPMSPLSASVIGYATLVMIHALIVSPAYTPAGLYHPMLLALGFLAVRNLGERDEKSAVIGTMAFGLMLAAWGLGQSALHDLPRATAVFETPATYAAVINMILMPALVWVLLGSRSAWLWTAGSLLAAALFAADSRGGLVALTAGIGFAAILALRVRRLGWRAAATVLALIAAGWVVAASLRALPVGDATPAPTPEARTQSTLSRLELYSLSWRAWRESPLAGTGYLTFRYTLEEGRARVPSYGASNTTWFVHNDYLQTLQEMGPLGLILLLGLTALPAALAYRRIAAVAESQQAVVIASASALTATATHALVDFPFYVPICLLLYGAILGWLDGRIGAADRTQARAWTRQSWFRALRTAGVSIAVVILLRPVAAEAAAEWGLRKFVAGQGHAAAIWLAVAQRIDPKDWRYHWYAGQFWDAQAADSGKREAARLAARAYADGFDANPLEVKNLLGMIAVQRRYRHLLDAPVDPVTLRQWVAQAVVLAPLNPDVRREATR
jgi:O-antigen ligase